MCYKIIYSSRCLGIWTYLSLENTRNKFKLYDTPCQHCSRTRLNTTKSAMSLYLVLFIAWFLDHSGYSAPHQISCRDVLKCSFPNPGVWSELYDCKSSTKVSSLSSCTHCGKLGKKYMPVSPHTNVRCWSTTGDLYEDLAQAWYRWRSMTIF